MGIAVFFQMFSNLCFSEQSPTIVKRILLWIAWSNFPINFRRIWGQLYGTHLKIFFLSSHLLFWLLWQTLKNPGESHFPKTVLFFYLREKTIFLAYLENMLNLPIFCLLSCKFLHSPVLTLDPPISKSLSNQIPVWLLLESRGEREHLHSQIPKE